MGHVRGRDFKPNPPRAGKTRTTYIKLRVIPLVPMPKSVLLEKVRESAESGRIDPDIDVLYVEYDHKYLNKRTGYERTTDKVQALQDFYAMITNADSATLKPATHKRKKRTR